MRSMEDTMDNALAQAGVPRLGQDGWRAIREHRSGRPAGEIRTIAQVVKDCRASMSVLEPDAAVRAFLDDCQQLHREVIEHVPENSQLGRMLRQRARRQQTELVSLRQRLQV
jgi:hypothetical protein